ncbi:MAG: hypothetical protein U5K69_29710 [Balneolaceae bacterium]|nr:hypothetical protein [Balneolaceae bacterium]
MARSKQAEETPVIGLGSSSRLYPRAFGWYSSAMVAGAVGGQC